MAGRMLAMELTNRQAGSVVDGCGFACKEVDRKAKDGIIRLSGHGVAWQEKDILWK